MSKPKIQLAILNTLCFYDLFSFPLTNIEIIDNLWQYSASYRELHLVLKEMLSNQTIGFADGFYFLPGRNNLVSIRKKRHLSSIKKRFQIEREKWLFSLSPFISMIGIANTLAYSNAKPDGDIDLLVVARPGRLFTARIFLTFWLMIFGRWRHGRHIKNRYCLSFFLTEDNLQLNKIKFPENDDIYLVYWTKWLTPVYSPKPQISSNYFIQNKWIKSFLPNANFINTYTQTDRPSFLAKFLELLFDGGLGDLLEKVLSYLMMTKIKSRTIEFDIDGTIASTQILKFHPAGKRKDYLQKWQSLCEKNY